MAQTAAVCSKKMSPDPTLLSALMPARPSAVTAAKTHLPRPPAHLVKHASKHPFTNRAFHHTASLKTAPKKRLGAIAHAGVSPATNLTERSHPTDPFSKDDGGRWTVCPMLDERLGGPFEVDLDKVTLKQLHFQGSICHSWQTWDTTLRLLGEGVFDLRPLISKRLPLSRWEEGFQGVINKSETRVLLRPD